MKKTYILIIVAMLLVCAALTVLICSKFLFKDATVPEEKTTAEPGTSAADPVTDPNTAGTTAPAGSSGPEGSSAERVTEMPEQTAAPGGTGTQERTTAAPEITTAPETTKSPKVTTAPDTTGKPAETGKSADTTAAVTTKAETTAVLPNHGDPIETVVSSYSCGSPNHVCKSESEHLMVCDMEKYGCPYCGSHSCPSFYATDRYGSAAIDFSLCPKYDERTDPAKFCQTCGMPRGLGLDHCTHLTKSMNCPLCGEWVEAGACHHCKGSQ